MPADITEGRPEIGHPISDDKYIRIPFAYSAGCFDVCKRISRIQEYFRLYGYGFIVRRDVLRLAREKKIRILSRECECLDIVLLTQFFEDIRIKLSYSSSVRIETGQYGYFQNYLFEFLFCTYSALSPARMASVMSSSGSAVTTGDGRMSPWVAMIIA